MYRVRARSQVAGEPVTARDLFLVRSATSELERPAANGDLLADIAAATGGSHLGPATELPADLAFEEPRIIRVDRRAEVELWSRPALLILALVFLGLEWGLRQKAGSR